MLRFVKAERLGIEPATCHSQVQRPTAAPPCWWFVQKNVDVAELRLTVIEPYRIDALFHAGQCYETWKSLITA